jgi:AraC-like DNA-binding protein
MVRTHASASGSHAGSSDSRRESSPAILRKLPKLAVPPGPDPLSEVLRTVKLTSALFFLVDATSPWGVEVPRASTFGSAILPRAGHIVSYHIVLAGSGYAEVPRLPPLRFTAGDVIVLPHGDPYALVSSPGGGAEFDREATLRFLKAMAAGELPFVIDEGGGGPERAQFVCGFLGCDARPFNPLLETLPRLLHVKRPLGDPDDLLDRLIDLTLAEARRNDAGGECIRLGLGELIFIEVIRRHLATLGRDRGGWLAGLRDAVVGRTLALLHRRPSEPWTLGALALEAGVSRSVLAERFTRLVGHPPMQYLTRWRVQLAARLLADGGRKVAAVAQHVGYASEAAFSRSFKRIAGTSPAEWRAAQGRRTGRDKPVAGRHAAAATPRRPRA